VCLGGSLLLGCSSDAGPSAPTPAPSNDPVEVVASLPEVAPDERSPALVRAQGIIEASCGGCHRSDLESAVPEALAVFDLWDPQWLARLDDAQHESMLVRLEDQGTPEPEIALVRAAIAEAQAQRAAPDRPRC